MQIDLQLLETLETQQVVVLVIGSGGREHAIAHKMAASSHVQKVLVAPGNGGTALAGGKISNVNLDISNIISLADYALSQNISLVVVGPEQPLVDGIVDAMTAVVSAVSSFLAILQL